METGRPLQVPPTCPGVTFTPSDHRSLGSPGHSSCPHAVEIRRYVTCTVPSQGWHLWRTLLCAIPSVVVNLQSTWNTQHWTAVRCYPCPLPNRPMASSWRNCLEASVSSYWQWRDAKDNHNWMGQFLHEDVGMRAGSCLHGCSGLIRMSCW